MKTDKAPIAAAAALVLALSASSAARAETTVKCDNADNVQVVAGGEDCLAIFSFGVEGMRAGGTLVAFLHGDTSKGGPADGFRRLAPTMVAPGRMSVVLIRQGYYDRDGRQSTGSNYNRNDNATAENVDNIGAALARLKTHHKANRLVVVGHSRGANIAGVLVGRRPGLIDAALLMSCPCDLQIWIATRQRSKGSYRSLSPLDYASGIPPATWIANLTGGDDDNTRPRLLARWLEVLARRNQPVRNLVIEGEPHNWSMRWFDRPDVQALLKEAIGG